jgi:hypothetical protein
MGTYAHRIYVQWGTDSAPASVFVLDAAGAKHTPTLTTPIAEVTAGTGNYFAVATYDHAWGAGRDFWRDAGGAEYPGDGPAPTDVVMVNGVIAALDTGGGTTGTGAGNIPLDHDGAELATFYIPDTNPVGVSSSDDLLQFKNGATGISGLLIRAYLASEYDTGQRVPKGITLTGADGRWFAPLMLFPGTYYIVTDTAGDGFMPNKIKAVIP